MAKRIEQFDEMILSCARKEFLDKGYELASLRTIAKEANVSTSTIYTRYKDKEGLFKALVSPAAEMLVNYVKEYLFSFTSLDAMDQKENREVYSLRGYHGFMDILYDHFDEFQLMVTSSTNGLYRYYLEQIVDVNTECTLEFFKATNNRAYLEGRLTKEFIHLISSSFYAGIFEIVVHQMNRKEAQTCVSELFLFYSNGWKSYL